MLPETKTQDKVRKHEREKKKRFLGPNSNWQKQWQWEKMYTCTKKAENYKIFLVIWLRTHQCFSWGIYAGLYIHMNYVCWKFLILGGRNNDKLMVLKQEREPILEAFRLLGVMTLGWSVPSRQTKTCLTSQTRTAHVLRYFKTNILKCLIWFQIL